MSISYWAVEGIGVDIDKKIFDLDKLSKLFETDFSNNQENPCWGYSSGDYDTSDIIDEVISNKKFDKHRKYLSFGDTGNADNGKFLLYTPRYPWDMSEEEKQLTKEEIYQMIVDVLLEVTIWTAEEIVEQIEDISIGGVG